VGEKNFGAEKRLKKPKTLGRGGHVFGSSSKRLERPYLNWCIGGYWFTPAPIEHVFADNSITFRLLEFACFTWSASCGDRTSPLPYDQRYNIKN
jgi:hypothetical protein